MLGYASPSTVASRRFSPGAVALIVAGHVALLALVVSARMELIPKPIFDPTVVIPIRDAPPPPPPPDPIGHRSLQPTPTSSQPTATRPVVEELPILGTAPGGDLTIPTGPYPGGEVMLDPPPLPHAVVRHPAALVTAESELRPPYPLAKQRLGEEASLSLRLTIAPDGRVTSVEPIGRADPQFLAAARRHILAHWRYRPATEDGSAVSTTLTIQLSFKLDDAG